MARRRNPVLQWMLAQASIALLKLLGFLPLNVSRGFARMLTPVLYRVPRLRNVALANLALAYGDTLSLVERKRIFRQVCDNMAVFAAELAHVRDLKGELLGRAVTVEGAEHLEPRCGRIFVGAHLGNWEWLAPVMANRGFKVAEVVRPLNNPGLDAYVQRIRGEGKILTIPKQHAGHEILRRLKEGYLVGILIDQSPRENGVPVRFFGQSCWATIGAAMAATRGLAPLHAVAMIRDADGHYIIKFSPEIPMRRTGNHLQDLLENTQRCQDVIEGLIREHPEQWLWVHRRWKPRPRLEQEWKQRLAEYKPADSSVD